MIKLIFSADMLYAVVARNENGDVSSTTKFRTAPTESRIIKFGTTSGLGDTRKPWDVLTRAGEQEYDFFILNGDMIYADYVPLFVPVADASVYSDLYSVMMHVSGFRNLAASTSIIPNWNWLEFGNYLPAVPADFMQAGKDAFEIAFGVNSTNTYRKVSWGPDVDVFKLDVFLTIYLIIDYY